MVSSGDMILLHLGHEKSPFPSISVKSSLYDCVCSISLTYLSFNVSVYKIKLLQDETTFISGIFPWVRHLLFVAPPWNKQLGYEKTKLKICVFSENQRGLGSEFAEDA